jgi:glycosyltransferase involved in cell wall biosynthesis
VRILIVSHVYAPSIGGVEAVGEMLAREFLAAGHEVKVVTQTPGPAAAEGPDVVRRPGPWQLAGLVRWADVVLHNNISLRMLWPVIAFRRPWVVGHHIWLTRADGRIGWQDRLKRFALRFARHVAPSRALAEALPVPCAVVGNPYRDDLFVEDRGAARSRDLVFVGRLVSDKGADILIDALAVLRSRGLTPTLTVIGSGPEEPSLRARVAAAGVAAQVDFAGPLTGGDLVRGLNAHRVLVVPSRWNEPFGIVALEGIACGCVVVGSSGGGLRDAIGECGLTTTNGDAAALAGALEQLLSNPDAWQRFRAAAPKHLAKYRPRNVASAYLDVMAGAR